MSVTARGGYQIIDLKDVVFDVQTPGYIDVPGAYEQAVNALKKPTVINHLNISVQGNVIENPPFYVSAVQLPSGDIQLVALMSVNQIMEIKITTEDSVKVSITRTN